VGVSGNVATLNVHSKHVGTAQWMSAGVVVVHFTTAIINCAYTASVLAGQASPGYAMTLVTGSAQNVTVETARPDGTLENRAFYLIIACNK
jgi:hypothetical protein